MGGAVRWGVLLNIRKYKADTIGSTINVYPSNMISPLLYFPKILKTTSLFIQIAFLDKPLKFHPTNDNS